MNYVIAAWLSCGAILLVYALRTVHRERSLRRSLPSQAPKRPGARAGTPTGPATRGTVGELGRPLAPEERAQWT
jgi:hypothetical protein